MPFLFELSLIYLVFLGVMLSPGPDMIVTMRNALGYSARAGIFTAAGIAAGLVIHMSYCVAGIGLLISQSVLLFNIIKWAGAGYLAWMGIRALQSKGTDVSAKAVTQDLKHARKTDRQAFANGFITNVFNPKATMFFLALFSQMLDPAMPLSVALAFCGLCLATAFLYFSALSVVLASAPARRFYTRASKWIDRVFGAVFIGLAVKLVLAKA